MKKTLLLLVIVQMTLSAQAQLDELPFGRVSHKDMGYVATDTSAVAVVLDERGQSFIDLHLGRLVFDYYVKIKILKKDGLKEGNFSIPLLKNDEKYKDTFEDLTASSYNYEGTAIKETKMNSRNKFTENFTNYDLIKFTLPDVRVGSVIEVRYKTHSPFYFRNFHTWEFQSDLPKVSSDYVALIPAYFLYNATLRGFLKLDINESSIVNDCVIGGAGERAQCTRLHFGIQNVPAFKEEEYMTAKSNFLSAIYFELATHTSFDGIRTKYTEEWKDVDQNLRFHENFGKQIKKASSVTEDSVAARIKGVTDDLQKAKNVYAFVSSYYTWDGEYGKYTDVGAKKAYETKKGNSGDINLTLVGALQQAGLNAFPVILSTRSNGLAIELYPVITGFDYVIAAVDIAGQRYLLDATSNLYPFGVLPMRCMNGRGRLIDKESAFIDLKPTQKLKQITSLDLALGDDGVIKGKVTVSYQGYNAVYERAEIYSAQSRDDYLKKLKKEWGDSELSNIETVNQSDVEKPMINKADIRIEGDGNASIIYFNPFFVDKIGKNPFVSQERSYPVDYGAPKETTYVLTLSFPESMVIDELPKSVALSLPNSGGRFTFSATAVGNKLGIVSNMVLTKAIYNPGEYHFLKELYARMLQIEESQIVFKKK